MALSGELAADGSESYESGDVQVSLDGDVSVVSLIGDVDLAMTEVLEDACDEVIDLGLPVRINMSRLTFIDSSGLGFLMRLIQTEPGGSPPRLVGASPLIRDTIRIVGLAGLVDLA